MNRSTRSTPDRRKRQNASTALCSAACIALLSMPGGRQAAGDQRVVSFRASDGWILEGNLRTPGSDRSAPGVVLIHGSKHEKDAYGVSLPSMLVEAGIAVLQFDIRGRGASSGSLGFHQMAPDQRRAVRLDVARAVEFLAGVGGVDPGRLALVAEQDSADAALLAGAGDGGIVAYALLSGRLSGHAKDAIAGLKSPVFCLVSKEDRRGFLDMTDAYLLSENPRSRLKVFDGIGFGTTMFSAWQYENPEAETIEEMMAKWLASVLRENGR